MSDKFLAALLESEIKRAYFIKVPKHVREADNYMVNLVYDVGIYIFQSLLEQRCKVGSIGHLVAQDLANKFK